MVVASEMSGQFFDLVLVIGKILSNQFQALHYFDAHCTSLISLAPLDWNIGPVCWWGRNTICFCCTYGFHLPGQNHHSYITMQFKFQENSHKHKMTQFWYVFNMPWYNVGHGTDAADQMRDLIFHDLAIEFSCSCAWPKSWQLSQCDLSVKRNHMKQYCAYVWYDQIMFPVYLVVELWSQIRWMIGFFYALGAGNRIFMCLSKIMAVTSMWLRVKRNHTKWSWVHF